MSFKTKSSSQPTLSAHSWSIRDFLLRLLHTNDKATPGETEDGPIRGERRLKQPCVRRAFKNRRGRERRRKSSSCPILLLSAQRDFFFSAGSKLYFELFRFSVQTRLSKAQASWCRAETLWRRRKRILAGKCKQSPQRGLAHTWRRLAEMRKQKRTFSLPFESKTSAPLTCVSKGGGDEEG